MKIQKANQTSFGWKDVTHKKLIDTALEDYPELQQYQPVLDKFVQRPDLDETGFKANKHFYFPSLEFGVFKSYLDFNGISNAYTCYTYHVTAMQDCVEKGNKAKALEHAGRAMHFLQDISQPHHTHSGNISKKASERSIHRKFETFVKDNQEKFISSVPSSSQKQVFKDFDDLFINTANYSASREPATKGNMNKWNNLAQDGINTALNATEVFMRKLNSLLNDKS